MADKKPDKRVVKYSHLKAVSKVSSKQPPIRTTAVLVPYEPDLPYLGHMSVTNHQLRLGVLTDAPDQGHYCKGHLVRFSYEFGWELPVVVAGYGPSNE